LKKTSQKNTKNLAFGEKRCFFTVFHIYKKWKNSVF